MGRYLWIFHAATVEFDFKDFTETVTPSLGECFALAAAFGRNNCQVFFWGAKLALKKALTTVTDMKQPELAWFARILQKSLQMIWVRAAK